jgi:hypothetical protein
MTAPSALKGSHRQSSTHRHQHRVTDALSTVGVGGLIGVVLSYVMEERPRPELVVALAAWALSSPSQFAGRGPPTVTPATRSSGTTSTTHRN